jgi:hypothetical protein
MKSFSFEYPFLYLINILVLAFNQNREKKSVELSSTSCNTSLVKCSVRGSEVVKALCCKPEGCGFETQLGEWIFLIYLTLPAALGYGVYSASNMNEYQK